MIRLQDTPYIVSYGVEDINSIPELIDDISDSVKKRLSEVVINKPLKCNITLVYSAIFNDSLNENDSESLG